MVHSITFNLAVDIAIRLENLVMDGINHTASQEIGYARKAVDIPYVPL